LRDTKGNILVGSIDTHVILLQSQKKILTHMRLLATNVRGGVIPDSGHWISEERPSFLTEQLFAFFGGNSTNTIK
jgi:pimeloyl-ACP methyl ester carboxylesterase